MADAHNIEEMLSELGQPLAGELSDAQLVEATLSRFANPETAALLEQLEQTSLAAEPSPKPRRRGLWIGLAVAALFVLAFSLYNGGLSLLQGDTSVHGSAASMNTDSEHVPRAVTSKAQPVPQTSRRVVAPEPEPATDPRSVATGETDNPEPTGEPNEPTGEQAGSEQQTGPEVSGDTTPEPTPLSPDELLQRAQQALAKGRTRRAKKMYQQLISQYPDSREARVTRVTLGRMALAAGQYQTALRSFERYLKGGDGPLREEAEIGRIQALGKLGRSQAERAAIAAFLGDPARANSLYRGRLERRLKALAGEEKSGL